ncbi:carbonic anhydrase [Corynebacterium halotolerans]|uniref:carbonic anhydrase n=1 Tax=Corynebacterium halotolerans TaxID=225326 RepID=UPI003CEDFB2B
MPMRDVERTPQAVWNALQEGNQRFVNYQTMHPNQDSSRRYELRTGQSPRALVLSCSDSRVPVEMIFDVGLGDLFVVRTAGEILDLAVLSSLEFAIETLQVPLVVVMGHESCGAVKATAEALAGGEIPGGLQRVMVEKVSPSILVAKSKGKTDIADFEREHVVETVDQVIDRSPVMQARMASGDVGIVGLRYRLSDTCTETVTTRRVE